MELKYGFMIMAILITGLSIFIIFAGCNSVHPEFDFNGNGADSIQKQCSIYDTQDRINKCVGKAMNKEYACVNWFFWLRY